MSTQPDSGHVAIVTGASRGIGYGIAEALVARGDRVCITGRSEDSLKEAVEKLGSDRVIGVAGKAHDEDHQEAVVARTMEAFGRVDYLVNNAGTNPVFGPIVDLDLDVARKVFETNVISALGFAQRTWKAWQKDNGGAIVNIASVAGISASPFIGAYGVSKAAMVNLTLQLAAHREIGRLPKEVRVGLGLAPRRNGSDPKHFSCPFAIARGDDGRVDVVKIPLLKEAVNGKGHAAAHAEDAAEEIRARSQVRDLAQELRRVSFLLKRVRAVRRANDFNFLGEQLQRLLRTR